MIYIDTSAIVASLDPLDPRRDEARKALELEEDKIVSELVVAELASVLTRNRQILMRLSDKLGVSSSIAFMAAILYILKRFNLKYVGTIESLGTLVGRFYAPFGYTLNLAEKIDLKTLDLLHLAYIKTVKRKGYNIHTMLTADKDFKEHEAEIREAVGVTVNLIK